MSQQLPVWAGTGTREDAGDTEWVDIGERGPEVEQVDMDTGEWGAEVEQIDIWEWDIGERGGGGQRWSGCMLGRRQRWRMVQ